MFGPGRIAGESQMLHRIVTLAIVAFLCSEQANFVNGAAVQVDGGTYPGLQ